MKEPAEGNDMQQTGSDADVLRTLRHDIKNQLSNIYLSLEQLRYELPDATEDCIFYMDLIAKSSAKIDNLLKTTE